MEVSSHTSLARSRERSLKVERYLRCAGNFALSPNFCVRASDPMHPVSENFSTLIALELVLYMVILPGSPPII
jgi:hypothetical protein